MDPSHRCPDDIWVEVISRMTDEDSRKSLPDMSLVNKQLFRLVRPLLFTSTSRNIRNETQGTAFFSHVAAAPHLFAYISKLRFVEQRILDERGAISQKHLWKLDWLSSTEVADALGKLPNLTEINLIGFSMKEYQDFITPIQALTGHATIRTLRIRRGTVFNMNPLFALLDLFPALENLDIADVSTGVKISVEIPMVSPFAPSDPSTVPSLRSFCIDHFQLLHNIVPRLQLAGRMAQLHTLDTSIGSLDSARQLLDVLNQVSPTLLDLRLCLTSSPEMPSSQWSRLQTTLTRDSPMSHLAMSGIRPRDVSWVSGLLELDLHVHWPRQAKPDM